jgi:hypothetical protein
MLARTHRQVIESALIRVIEDSQSTVDQVLDATRQLTAIKRVKPIPRRKRPGQIISNSPIAILGTK